MELGSRAARHNALMARNTREMKRNSKGSGMKEGGKGREGNGIGEAVVAAALAHGRGITGNQLPMASFVCCSKGAAIGTLGAVVGKEEAAAREEEEEEGSALGLLGRRQWMGLGSF